MPSAQPPPVVTAPRGAEARAGRNHTVGAPCTAPLTTPRRCFPMHGCRRAHQARHAYRRVVARRLLAAQNTAFQTLGSKRTSVPTCGFCSTIVMGLVVHVAILQIHSKNAEIKLRPACRIQKKSPHSMGTWPQSKRDAAAGSRVVQHARGVLNCTLGACSFTCFGRVTPCTPRILRILGA